ncbi:GNAT family N-acetyltransferase [Natronobacterium gregoryi]|uniref:Acetyltransferase, ribosomal protein N-acetylase n=2 Tax=Natronobacterium gregoryi TaxID=44930 RepID=L0AJY6_NATGS|nr:GNAT family protein [Natronobacterium gregoryi]AFZ73375.1 acetyltransferase, ribosomal protein N-acetylase [Natronobacterium gregoryi SP2]ELY68571.1 GCN5-related N-acetyltransferase [Natronobacterium gregoryi SP2]PLK19656.1 N-acetyltransferase [Natronobacterium gregoryi SP2]SFI73749.1 Protein N-acetyltransferase, RimJ/RimL family [Natronobacterium gregoryi]
MPGPLFLEGNAVTLRPIEREDLEFLHRVMNDPAVWRPALDIDPMNYEQGEEFFETVLSSSDGVHCLACTDEEPLGVLSLTGSQYGPDETSRSRAAEIAYWFAPEHHGQGYGSDATARLIQYAFEDRNLRRLEARVGSFNDASIGLLESLGFEHEGTLREAAWYRGEYHDMCWYGLLRDEWQSGQE